MGGGGAVVRWSSLSRLVNKILAPDDLSPLAFLFLFFFVFALGQAAQQPPPQVDPCDMDKQNFGQCLQNNNNDVTSCQFVFEALQTCQVCFVPSGRDTGGSAGVGTERAKQYFTQH